MRPCASHCGASSGALRAASRALRARPHRSARALCPLPKPSLPRGGSALRDLMPRYRILKIIGESDKAVVYLATSLDLEARCRVESKQDSRRQGTNEPQVLARERAALERHTASGNCRNPRLRLARRARVSGDGLLCAGDLKERMRQGISEEDAMRYMGDIAAALRVVHDAGSCIAI
jgi:hypothetical protein